MQNPNKFSSHELWWSLLAGAVLSLLAITGSAYLLSGLLKLYALVGLSGKHLSGPSILFWTTSIVSILPFVAIVCVPLGVHLKENPSLVGVLVGLSAAVGYAAISAFVEARSDAGYLIDMISIIVLSFLFVLLGSRLKKT